MGNLGAHKLTSLPNDCEAVDSHKAVWQIRAVVCQPQTAVQPGLHSTALKAVGIWVLYLNYQEVQGQGGQPRTFSEKAANDRFFPQDSASVNGELCCAAAIALKIMTIPNSPF